MKVSLNWLREFVDLPPTAEALVDLLTLAGVEVENVQTRGVDIANVVVAQIRESVQHPNADRLSVCQVDDGSGTARQIVCGAKNYRVGDKVPLALPGAVLPGDFKIKVGKLRGVESQGMLCSGKELNLAEDAEGLLILPETARVGAPLSELFPSDTILDLEITPNRGDLLSHYGIAREVAALTERALRAPQVHAREFNDCEDVAISTKHCWLYSARRIQGVKVGPSPDWMRRRLEVVGLRAINNIVDVTNYVMMELGQPLHAFDAAKLQGSLRVRSAAANERFLALDGKTYSLTADDIVIADDERAVALGGVMGGADTGVTDDTVDVWLESADFQPQSIRRTSRRLGLVSDSSYRFERGIDFDAVLYASQRATELIAEIAGGSVVGPLRTGYSPPFNIDPTKPDRGTIFFGDTPSDALPFRLEFRADRAARLLGVNLPEGEMSAILRRLGLKCEAGEWWAPSFRPDLTREVDLIEEIARVVGMDKIPARTQARFAPASATDRAYDRAMELRRAFVGLGLHEARSLTLVSAEPRGSAFTQTAPDTLQRVKNPMIDDQVVLRPNLMHGLLGAVARNIRAGARSIRLFEIGRTFSTIAPEEFSHAALVLSGPLREHSWRGEPLRDADLFDVKGIIAGAIGADATFEPEENSALALSIAVKLSGEPVGLAGQLWPADARSLDAAAPVLFAELDLEALAKARAQFPPKIYRETPRFPAVTRDLALVAPLTLAHETIASTLGAAGEPLLAHVQLFDVFCDPSGARVPADQRSLAYSFTYRSAERTLTAEEVNAAHARLKERLKSDLGVTLRE